MSIYKFVHEDRIDILENFQIRFTQPIEFNDPFEMYPYLESIFPNNLIENAIGKQTDEEYEQNYLNGIPKEIRNSFPDEYWLLIGKALRPTLEPIVINIFNNGMQQITCSLREILPKSINKTIGVLCCAGNPFDARMWGHYSNCHKGFVIVFDENHEFFQQNVHPAKELRKIRKVKYSKKRPLISSYKNWNIEDIFFTKSIEWAYESEWRTIKPLSEANKIFKVNDVDVFLFDIPNECIQGVFLGVRTTDEIKDKIISIFKENEYLKNKFIYQKKLSEDTYELTNSIIY